MQGLNPLNSSNYGSYSKDEINDLLNNKITVGTTIEVANGGTGATDAATARSNLDITKANIGLGNVDNAKQMPIAGGTFTGNAAAYNTNRSGGCLRNIYTRTSAGADVSSNSIVMHRK